MGFKLRLNLAALCAFVPDRSGTCMHALFLNASDPRRLASDGECLHAHAAQLIYFADRADAQALGQVPEPIADPPELPGAGQSPVGYTLRRQQLVVRDAQGKEFVVRDPQTKEMVSVPLKLARGRKEGTRKPNPKVPEELRDYSWVARIGRACSGSGRLRASCIQRDPQHLVAARITLTAGELGAHPDTISPDLHVFRELRDTGAAIGKYEQALAWAAQLVVPVESDAITIWSAGMDEGRDFRWALKLSPKNPKDPVEVWVANFPVGKIPANQHEAEQGRNSGSTPDRHFEWFYDLSAGSWDAPRPRPVPAGPPRVPPENCYAAAFDGLAWEPTEGARGEVDTAASFSTRLRSSGDLDP